MKPTTHYHWFLHYDLHIKALYPLISLHALYSCSRDACSRDIYTAHCYSVLLSNCLLNRIFMWICHHLQLDLSQFLCRFFINFMQICHHLHLHLSSPSCRFVANFMCICQKLHMDFSLSECKSA